MSLERRMRRNSELNRNKSKGVHRFMKTISFTEENKETYDILYEVARAKPLKGIEEILKAAAVVEKLKEIGVDKGEKVGDFQALKLKEVPTNLELENEHFRYIKDAFDTAQISNSAKIELLAQTVKLLKSAETG